jgi:hypothetical protein
MVIIHYWGGRVWLFCIQLCSGTFLTYSTHSHPLQYQQSPEARLKDFQQVTPKEDADVGLAHQAFMLCLLTLSATRAAKMTLQRVSGSSRGNELSGGVCFVGFCFAHIFHPR